MFQARTRKVLVTGIYLLGQRNNITHIIEQFSATKNWDVIQKWIAVGNGDTPREAVGRVTVMNLREGLPKFVLLNKLLSNEKVDEYDFIIISDDDISLPSRFLDTYLDLVVTHDFALCQPARTLNSFIDHPFVAQLEGIKARRTRFVEIGPLVSLRRDIFPILMPFDESAHMGWGYDFVWPYLVEKSGRRIGIVDATPVEHSMRPPVKNYNYDEADKSMQDYLSQNPHLSKREAFRILESYT